MSLLLAAGTEPVHSSVQDVECALCRIHGNDAIVRSAQGQSVAIGLVETPDTSIAEVPARSPESLDRDVAIVLGYVDLDSRTVTPGAGSAVLIDKWRAVGTGFLRDLDGSFAIVLHDALSEKTLIATDCFSSRTLWIHSTPSAVAIASDLRTLPVLRRFLPALDLAYLWSFLNHACTIDDRSPFEGIRALRPGEVVVLERGRIIERREYTRPAFSGVHRSDRDVAEDLLHVLRVNVSRCISTSSSPCLFLSGGVDSRLLAALCPAATAALTLADRENRETAIASRVASVAGLAHRVVIRDPSWYPDVLEEAAIGSNGIWAWNEAPYIPLRQANRDFHHDAAILGFGSNTYFKGNHLGWKRLWEDRPAEIPLSEHLLALVMAAPQPTTHAATALKPIAGDRCQDAYRAAALERITGIMGASDHVGDVWELFWSGSLTTVVQAYNLACLRDFARDHSAFGGKEVQRIYLDTTPKQRISGSVIRHALRFLGPTLARIPDANTWLPAYYPAWLHRHAFSFRLTIARGRAALLRVRRSTDYRSRGSWPHSGLLWLSSPALRNHMDRLIQDESAFPDEFFDRSVLRTLWHSHLDRSRTLGNDLNVLATFGLFHRACVNP